MLSNLRKILAVIVGLIGILFIEGDPKINFAWLGYLLGVLLIGLAWGLYSLQDVTSNRE